ncbi:hypothetical protein [Candidatus Binatus sp.]|uniref:hypothetical protein n=1 Tax=Candidatus Binatus sp. TaxID=2811406 RepID=UPI003BAE248D
MTRSTDGKLTKMRVKRLISPAISRAFKTRRFRVSLVADTIGIRMVSYQVENL